MTTTIEAPAGPPVTPARPSSVLEDEDRKRQLRRMKTIATGLLVAATVLFALARTFEHDVGWLAYVRAFAEASMVGALADWFAVTALFRHPLGVPIPHTAIIANRKDEIGKGLANFLESYFLTDDVVSAKLAETPIASRLGQWLAQPANAARVADQSATVVRAIVEALRDDEVQQAIEDVVARKVRETPVAPLVGQGLEMAIAGGRHQQLLTAIMAWVRETLDENRESLRTRLAQESPWWVPEAIDDRIYAKIFDGVQRLLHDVGDNPNHELRATFDRGVHQLAEDLKASPGMQARAEELKEELLAQPSLRQWSGSVWADLKRSVLEGSADPRSGLRQRVEAGLVSFGERLATDASLQAKVDGWIASAVAELVTQSQHEITSVVSATVARWNPEDATRRIELHVGHDLQYIRINGTVVGGLAGLVIYAVSQGFLH